jgi:hypothetical protein
MIANLQLKLQVSYQDDRALHLPQIQLVDNYVGLNGDLRMSRAKLSPTDLQAASKDCITDTMTGFALLFELAMKSGVDFHYLRTPDANSVIRRLMSVGYGGSPNGL